MPIFHGLFDCSLLVGTGRWRFMAAGNYLQSLFSVIYNRAKRKGRYNHGKIIFCFRLHGNGSAGNY